MSQFQQRAQEVSVSAENIGGIDETEVTFSPGTTVLAGRNATNRTSFLQALMAALGSDRVSLKGDTDEGTAKLTVGDETYTRTLTRVDGTITTGGNPYLDPEEAELADLFAFLLESNEARRGVAQGDDLRELITRPIDTDAIEAEITQLEQEKRQVDGDLDELTAYEQRIPDLEQERTRLRRQIEEKRDELESTEAEIESADASIDETREEKSALDSELAALRDTRSDLEDVRLDIETEEKSLDALRDEKAEIEDDLASISGSDTTDVSEIDSEIERLRSQRQTIESTVSELQSVIQFNEEMLEGTNSEVAAALRDRDDEASDESVTDRLLDDSESVVCWTCGSEVEADQIESTLDRLRNLRQEKFSERNALKEDINSLQEEKRDQENTQRERERLERRLDETEAEIESRKSMLPDLRERREELQDKVEQLEQNVEELQAEEHEELIDLHKQANQLEFDLGRLQGDLDDVEEKIESLQSQLEERDRLEDRRAEIKERLTKLRSRIDEIEADAVDQFNEHMASVLEILEYENLERIWIERTEKEVREGRRKVSRSSFDLHIVRRAEDGTTYEDTIDHLSESEREVTGLIFALAGYLVHDVYETLPFILLDSLEAIDSERIAALVEYLEEYAGYLVVALLPEDASALDSSYQRISDI